MQSHVIRLCATLCLAAIALAACGGGSSGGGSDAVVTPTPHPTAVPNAIYLGAFVNPNQTNPPPGIGTLESQIGRTFALSMHYYGFTASFPGASEADDFAHGRVPIISWECAYPNADIAQGIHDDIIEKTAASIKSYGHPIFIRYLWEMNLVPSGGVRQGCLGPDDTNGFNPADFIAAWQHIYAVFQKAGVTNVIWLWCPSGANNPSAYYPGASYVNWVGFDKYDTSGTGFVATMTQPYAWLKTYGQPIMIGETGAMGDQHAFFSAAVPSLKSSFPAIKGMVYFDAVGAMGSWAITDFAAFSAMANDPYFSGLGSSI